MHENPLHQRSAQPSPANDFLADHAALLAHSYERWTGKPLLAPDDPQESLARRLFEAPFVVVSHDTAPDPIFNYANRAAQTLFEMGWEEFVALPSRLSAEPGNREQRERLLAEVARNGYVADYRGVRISAAGKRFMISAAVIWNLVDENGRYYGQAAKFADWTPLPRTAP